MKSLRPVFILPLIYLAALNLAAGYLYVSTLNDPDPAYYQVKYLFFLILFADLLALRKFWTPVCDFDSRTITIYGYFSKNTYEWEKVDCFILETMTVNAPQTLGVHFKDETSKILNVVGSKNIKLIKEMLELAKTANPKIVISKGVSDLVSRAK